MTIELQSNYNAKKVNKESTVKGITIVVNICNLTCHIYDKLTRNDETISYTMKKCKLLVMSHK